MSVTGLAIAGRHAPIGTELTADAAVDDTVLHVDWGELFSDEGGTLELNGVTLDYVTADEAADTVTLAEPLAVAALEGDRVHRVEGGQVATDYVIKVDVGPGDPVTVPVPYGDRDLWPDGEYDDPVPVVISDDYDTIIDVPGRTPVRDGGFIEAGTVAAGNVEVTSDEGTLHIDAIETPWSSFPAPSVWWSGGSPNELEPPSVAGFFPDSVYDPAAMLRLYSGFTMDTPSAALIQLESQPSSSPGLINLYGNVYVSELLNVARARLGGWGNDINVLAHGRGHVDTNGSGIGKFNHGLVLGGDYTVQLTSRGNANFRAFNVTEENSTNFKVRVMNADGDPVADATNQSFGYIIIG